jgi:hypothetical protein
MENTKASAANFNRSFGTQFKSDRAFTLEVPFKYLIPVRPEAAHQTVIAFDGLDKGHQFKIQCFSQDVCRCSDLKVRSYRRKINTEIPTKDIVVIWG